MTAWQSTFMAMNFFTRLRKCSVLKKFASLSCCRCVTPRFFLCREWLRSVRSELVCEKEKCKFWSVCIATGTQLSPDKQSLLQSGEAGSLIPPLWIHTSEELGVSLVNDITKLKLSGDMATGSMLSCVHFRGHVPNL